MKLGVMGVTILVSSGDDGAAGFHVKSGDMNCGYFPIFPATSPYVTVIGATKVTK
jgi:subtilase family serine protease